MNRLPCIAALSLSALCLISNAAEPVVLGEYDVDRETLAADISDLVAALLARNLLVLDD